MHYYLYMQYQYTDVYNIIMYITGGGCYRYY